MNGKFSGSAFQDVPSNPPNLAGMHPPTPAQFDRAMSPPQQPLNQMPSTPIPYYENGTLVPYEGGNDSAPITHGQHVTTFPQYPRGPIEELILTLKHYIGVQNRHHENHIVFAPLLYNLTSGLAAGASILPQQGMAPDFGTFYAQTLMVDNPSGYTFYIQELNRYIPPNVFGYAIPCFPAVQRLTISVFGGSQATTTTMVIIPREEPMYDASPIPGGTAALMPAGADGGSPSTFGELLLGLLNPLGLVDRWRSVGSAGAGLGVALVAPPNGIAQTVTAAANTNATITLPAVANQRNHIRSITASFNPVSTTPTTFTVQDNGVNQWNIVLPAGAGPWSFFFGDNGIANVAVNNSMTVILQNGGGTSQGSVSVTDWVG